MTSEARRGSRPAREYCVALTGGIGSGKSTVADAFQKRGIPIFDADIVARDLVQPGQPALAEIASAFGKTMLTLSGDLDRRQMRDLVFADAGARRQLEGILHPKVRDVLLNAVATSNGRDYSMLVIPLFVESHDAYAWVDRALVIDVPFETQVGRVMQRDRIDRDAALRIVAVQASREQRLALANDVIDNSGQVAVLGASVERLHKRYCALAARANT